MKAQNQNIDDLPFQAVLGVWGSWAGLALNVLCILAQFYIAVSPIDGSATAYDFFVDMLALPIIIVCFIGWKLWHKTRWVRAGEADLLSGRREMDLAGAKQAELEERANWSPWKKYVRIVSMLTAGCITGSVSGQMVSLVLVHYVLIISFINMSQMNLSKLHPIQSIPNRIVP